MKNDITVRKPKTNSAVVSEMIDLYDRLHDDKEKFLEELTIKMTEYGRRAWKAGYELGKAKRD